MGFSGKLHQFTPDNEANKLVKAVSQSHGKVVFAANKKMI